jgi:hypothetical protein
MSRLRIALTLFLIVVCGVFVPTAMAADYCAVMNYMCGASSTATPPTVSAFTVLISVATVGPVSAIPQSERSALEPLPKSPTRSA